MVATIGGSAAVIDLATCRGPRGADVPPVVPTIDGGKLTPGKAVIVPTCRGHRPGKRRGVPRGRARADDRRREADAGQLGKVVIDLASAGTSPAAVPVVPTIDGGQADAGQLGKAVIDLASAGAFPRPCPCRPWCRRAAAVPVVPTIDAGQFQGEADAGKVVIDLASAGAFPRPYPCRRSTPASSKGKLTPARRSSTWQRAAVPVVPMIDAGQFQGQADGGQAGY